VAYDALAESVALIEARRVEPVHRLTRRRRFAAMAVDVAGDVAVTMFARRGVGCTWEEIHVLALRDGEWTWLGGGGSTSDSDQDLLADRPTVLPRSGSGDATGADPKAIVVNGSGGVLDNGDGTAGRGRSGRWISYAEVRVSARVASLQVADRLLLVPWHGRVPVAWSGNRTPLVTALDEAGGSLGETLLPTTR
jgi:hypothetical protein